MIYPTNTINIACVGDSITFGARLENRVEHSYPAQLQKIMGEAYNVTNFGVGGCTLIRKGTPTVWNELEKIIQSKPNIIIISLGTNDTVGGKRKCWDHKEDYYGDYLDLIDTLQDLPSKPKIWICLPTPMVLETPEMNEERIANLEERRPRLQEFIHSIQRIAKEKNVGLIDLNTPLDHKPMYFTEKDGVHPNQAGYRAVAELIALKIMDQKN